jgi:hypothetical protein
MSFSRLFIKRGEVGMWFRGFSMVFLFRKSGPPATTDEERRLGCCWLVRGRACSNISEGCLPPVCWGEPPLSRSLGIFDLPKFVLKFLVDRPREEPLKAASEVGFFYITGRIWFLFIFIRASCFPSLIFCASKSRLLSNFFDEFLKFYS